jgi:hypothetical protein
MLPLLLIGANGISRLKMSHDHHHVVFTVGKTVKIKILREGHPQEFAVTTGELAEEESPAEEELQEEGDEEPALPDDEAPAWPDDE